MKVVSVSVALASLALIALTLVPATGGYRSYVEVAEFVAVAVVLVTIIVGWRELPPATATLAEPVRVASAAPNAAAALAAPLPITPVQAEAEIVSFLASLQEKGRLVDFLWDDIAQYSDAQVGAAARVVHQGCKAVLQEHFRIVPVRTENEGAKVTVTPGYAADEYRLVGKISGQAPFSGTLMHRGWKTDSVKLPRVLGTGGDRLPTIAPAEVELQ